MPIAALRQRTIFEDDSRVAVALPLGPLLGSLHPGGVFPLVEDPRRSDRALLFGMMVLRGASRSWSPRNLESAFPSCLGEASDWCFDVEGIGGSWPVSGGNALDAFRLALQYGTVDAVMAGSATMAREGVARDKAAGHLWQPYAPLGWPSLRDHRAVLEPAIADLRRDWQREGFLSPRRYPAQILVTRSGCRADELLAARIFHDRHPDGSPIEAWILTSEEGEAAFRDSDSWQAGGPAERLLVCSPPGDPAAIDLTRVPELLRRRLGAGLVQHDGGALALAAFLEGGAVAQLQLTLMRGRSVKEVVAGSERLAGGEREKLLASWQGRARTFPASGGPLPPAWVPFYAVVEDRPEGEALIVSFDSRNAKNRSIAAC